MKNKKKERKLGNLDRFGCLKMAIKVCNYTKTKTKKKSNKMNEPYLVEVMNL